MSTFQKGDRVTATFDALLDGTVEEVYMNSSAEERYGVAWETSDDTVMGYSEDQLRACGTREEQMARDVRRKKHNAWIEGYEACRRGEQMHSPYREEHQR